MTTSTQTGSAYPPDTVAMSAADRTEAIESHAGSAGSIATVTATASSHPIGARAKRLEFNARCCDSHRRWQEIRSTPVRACSISTSLHTNADIAVLAVSCATVGINSRPPIDECDRM